ncbi:MAG: hypothetical protein CMM60_03840 [Rhodospirillaceae bacterium]|nr:hypothetical protein [Rhodospirillaceae bacterium]
MNYKTITGNDLITFMESDQIFFLVDVLSREHYVQEHIPGAISIPFEEIGHQAKQMFKKDDMIIVYCASFACQASSLAASKLVAFGFNNVYEYEGGLKDYKITDLPLEGSSLEEVCGEDAECKRFIKQVRYNTVDPDSPSVICDENAAEGGCDCG